MALARGMVALILGRVILADVLPNLLQRQSHPLEHFIRIMYETLQAVYLGHCN
jgi:hypothetical protein